MVSQGSGHIGLCKVDERQDLRHNARPLLQEHQARTQTVLRTVTEPQHWSWRLDQICRGLGGWFEHSLAAGLAAQR